MSVNYERLCRLCLSRRGDLQPIFSTTSSDDPKPGFLASLIKDCVSIQIAENDELPKNICSKCVNNVNNWHLFKNVCERAQNKLQSLLRKDGSQLEEVKIKTEPLSDEAHDDGVLIDGQYPESENAGPSSKVQPEGPPILASLGLTPRSDKGMESEKDYDEEEEDVDADHPVISAPSMPEVSITVMRPTGETLQSRQGIQQLASKECLVCGRSYRYSHNARRHELSAHNFDRYTNKVNKPPKQMQPKLRPNPFNPKSRLMPNPISHKMRLLPKSISVPKLSMPKIIPPKPIPIKSAKAPQNNLPYPLRIKALKDLQIKKKEPQVEPQILKNLLTAKPEVLVSEPEIMNSAPESPETLISEPEIASFQVEAILSEPEGYDEPQDHDQVDGVDEAKNQNHNYDTVDMESDNEIEIARQKEGEVEPELDEEMNEEQNSEDDIHHNDVNMEDSQDNNKELNDEEAAEEDGSEENAEGDLKEEEENVQNEDNEPIEDNEDDHDEQEDQEEHDDEVDEGASPLLTPEVELNEGEGHTNSNNSELNEEGEEDADETNDINDTIDNEDSALAVQQEYDPNKIYVTKAQKDFIEKYRDIIEQINTKRCLCCDKEHPRRKSVIQHLQKNGHRVPKHTCYNCVITFGQIGALLSHMRANVCTDLWKIIYSENGITDDMIIQGQNEVKGVKPKDIFNSRSYACKLCPAKYQLKQFIVKHVLDVHEDGQSQLQLQCVHCGSRFKEREKLKRHIRRGECIVYIVCELCSERFKNLQQFNDHALAVHGNCDEDNQNKCVDGRPTNCHLCDTKASNYPNLIKHLRVVHFEDKPYFCTNCDAKFEQMTELNKHIYDVHADKAMGITSEPDMSLVKEEVEEYHYSCTECNAIFETVDAWTDHQVAEHNQVAHHCDQCDKKFLRPSELAEHKNTHLRVKFYPCSVCSNSYSTPQKLAAHVQESHPGAGSSAGSNAENEFYCDVCIRAFKSRQAYSNHMRIHAKVPTTNRKPGESRGFAPQIVGKPIKQLYLAPTQPQTGFVFKQNSNVPAAPYCCDICGKGFMHKKNIWKHKKVLHADLIQEKNDSEENTMHASTEDDEYVDENGAILSTPQFDSFNFSNFGNNARQSDGPLYTCDVCYGKFSCRDSLRKHKRTKHSMLNFGASSSSEPQMQLPPGDNAGRSSCTICKITFADKKSYYRHRKNVHKTSVQMCKICGKPLNSTLELYEHLKAAHARELLGYNANQGASKPPVVVKQDEDEDYEGDQDSVDPGMDYQARYPCDACGKQFVGLLALQNHQCVHQISSQPQTFDCEICHKSYTSIAALKSHRGWHLRSPDGKAAANNTGLWMPHNKVTSKVSKHEVVDPSQLAKVQHVTTAPPVNIAKRKLPPEVEVTIVNPNKKMRSDDSIEMEQQNSTGGVMEDRYCAVCDREFTKRAAYQRHMEEVHQPNSVFCRVCNKSFTRKSTLLVHMKKHYEGGEGGSSMTGQMDEEYDNDMGLLAHRTHQPEEESDEESEDDGASIEPPGEFTCGQCGDGVATPRDLIAHRAMHATPTKYFCNVCKVYFARALDLSSHTRARHSESEKSAMYPCAMCERSYMNKKSLQRHIEMAH